MKFRMLLHVFLFLTSSFVYASEQHIVLVSQHGGLAKFNNKLVPTKSLQDALSNAKSGQIIQLTAGSYSGNHVVKLKALEIAPLIIRGLGEKTLFNGQFNPSDDNFCLWINKSSWIQVENIHFQHCWKSAIYVKNSQYITFANLYGENTRFLVYARGMKSHHLLLEDSEWNQDPTGKVWHTIPWAESHHGQHDYFNGGMLSSKEILGSVVFRNNIIRNAFNGFRMVGIEYSQTVQNANVEVYGNYFENIRDNPIEPEDDAHNWWIHHNKIKNAHALFSFTEIGGGNWYVFRNVGWFDQVPGGSEHNGGKIFKFTDSGPFPNKPLFVFNNSWYSRSPLFSGGPSRLFKSWNNAIYFDDEDKLARKKYWHDSYASDFNLSNIQLQNGLEELGQDKNSVTIAGPLFIDGANGDFRPSSNFAGLDKGKIITLGDWRSDYDGEKPDIGAYEGNHIPQGPSFSFDDSSYQEAPRIVQVFSDDQTLSISFSVPMVTTATQANFKLNNNHTVSAKCQLKAYKMNCDMAKDITIENIKTVLLPRSLKGISGLNVTLWAAPKQPFEFLLLAN
ncbi:hypothetical protein QX776_09655 [Alteromonadaceae bacterium BrNp21-10]|nr:hypothetical protein [Alteromonadaceae bacterium BrNp21-10]